MIISQALRAGRKIPDRILNAPELKPGLSLYLQAFFDLDSERPIGFTSGKIPFRAVLVYADFYEFDREQTEDLLYFVRNMDDTYLKWLAKKTE